MLAPAPDFRYVGVFPGPHWSARILGGVVASGTTVAAAMLYGYGARAAVLGGALTSFGAALSLGSLQRIRRARLERRGPSSTGARTVPMAIVPWGILLEHEVHPRVLHWGGITRVDVDTAYGRDGASDFTTWSIVTIETERERFTGCTPGAVPLDRLMAHFHAYAREQSHAVALDLDGRLAEDGPVEPQCEPLLRAAQAWVASGPASSRLGLEAAGYRRVTGRTPSPRTFQELRQVLRDRTERAVDPRPFAAVVAAELGARDLADDLVSLVQSPHPVVAAVAKAAGRRLGVATTRVGTLDEVAPFLMPLDVETLETWSRATSVPER